MIGCQHRLPSVTTTEAQPDLTLAQCCERWKVKSRNAVKARARALGVELLAISSTCTVWPGEHVALGDELNTYLAPPIRGKLADFPHRLPSAAASTDSTETQAMPAPAAVTDRRRGAALMAPTASTDALAAFTAMLAAVRPAPAADPLAVPRALAEAADAGHWLSTGELAQLVGMHRSTVGRWEDGHCPRPGFRLQRRKDAGSVWWLVARQ
jgi:hypothetical protein